MAKTAHDVDTPVKIVRNPWPSERPEGEGGGRGVGISPQMVLLAGQLAASTDFSPHTKIHQSRPVGSPFSFLGGSVAPTPKNGLQSADTRRSAPLLYQRSSLHQRLARHKRQRPSLLLVREQTITRSTDTCSAVHCSDTPGHARGRWQQGIGVKAP